MNAWERLIKRGLETLSITKELCCDRKEWSLRISRSDPAQYGKGAGI